MRALWVLLVGAFLLFSFHPTQQKQITGKVVLAGDSTVLPGVHVGLKGSHAETTTNSEGVYEIQIPASGNTLVFSFIGLQTKEVLVGDQRVINVMLDVDAAQLSEVVVSCVCYASETRPTQEQSTRTRKRSKRPRNRNL